MKSFISNLLLLSITVLLLLAVLEIICRIVPLTNDTDPTYKLAHDILPYTMKPDTESTSSWGHSIKINSHGLRDYEYEYKKPDDVFRILVLGDSSAFAYGNKMEDGFTKILEKKLNAFTDRKYDKVEVINAGHPGYNTYDEYNYYRLYGHKYDPDAVIVAVITNDFDVDSLELVIRDGVDSTPGSFWLYIPSWVKKCYVNRIYTWLWVILLKQDSL